MQYEDITFKIIGCALEVHKVLGNGFQEITYQRALAIEMEKQKINFKQKFEMSIQYKDQDIGTRKVDFLVEDYIMVELKALINLDNVHLAQAMNYLEAYNLKFGLILNFGANSLQHKRIHNNSFNTCNPSNPFNHGSSIFQSWYKM